jgi:hypothetical protein
VTSVPLEFDEALALARNAGLASVKLGTEEEALGNDEILWLREVLPPDLNVIVKIGGPCARADLRLAGTIAAQAVIAPMVESAFALRRFVEAADVELGIRAERTAYAFNLETSQAVVHLDAMLDSPWAARLAFVNIGRTDLAASLGWTVGDPRLDDVVASCIARLHARGLEVHVGGRVTQATLLPLLHRQAFEGFHTRMLAFTIRDHAQAALAIDCGLALERLLLDRLADRFPARAHVHRDRAVEVLRRLAG